MRALVTGGTGFIGSHIAYMLVADGHSVRVVHRTTSKLTTLKGLNCERVIGELTDIDSLREACQNIDWVFHVAAVADYWRANKNHMFEINVEGTRRILQAARETGVKRVVFTSSAAAVGLCPDGQLADETVKFNLPPDLLPYGYSKSLAEEVVHEAVTRGQDVVTLNPVVVLGPGDLNLISGSYLVQMKRMGPIFPVSSGGIPVTDVRDVARWHIIAAQKGRAGERYLLGTANYPLRVWSAMVAESMGVRRLLLPVPNVVVPMVAAVVGSLRKIGITTPVDPGQVRMSTRKIHYDYHKAWAELGEPQIDMQQSLCDTYEWYKANGYIG